MGYQTMIIAIWSNKKPSTSFHYELRDSTHLDSIEKFDVTNFSRFHVLVPQTRFAKFQKDLSTANNNPGLAAHWNSVWVIFLRKVQLSVWWKSIYGTKKQSTTPKAISNASATRRLVQVRVFASQLISVIQPWVSKDRISILSSTCFPNSGKHSSYYFSCWELWSCRKIRLHLSRLSSSMQHTCIDEPRNHML